MSTATESPATEPDALAMSGDSFAARLAAGKEASAAPAEAKEAPPFAAPEPAKEPPAKEPVSTESKPTDAKPAAPAKAKATPLDLPAKKEATPPAEDDEMAKLLAAEPPSNVPAAVKSSHAILRKGYETAQAKIKELTAQLEERSKSPAAAPETESRLKAAEELVKQREAELERVAFERSPKFQRFVTAANDELTAAKAYLEGSEIDPNVIELASRATGANRLKILSENGVDGNAIAAISPHLARIDALNRDKTAAQENWKGTQAQWEAEQRQAVERQNATVKEHEDRVFSTVGKKLSETLEPFQKVDGNEEWNSGVAAREAQVKAVFDGTLPLEKTSEVLYKGVAFDVIHEAWKDLRSKFNDLVAENERIRAVQPGVGSTKADSGAQPASTGDAMRDAASTFDMMKAKHRV